MLNLQKIRKMRYNSSGKYWENQKNWLLLEDDSLLMLAIEKCLKIRVSIYRGVTFKRRDGYYTNSQDPIFHIDSAYL